MVRTRIAPSPTGIAHIGTAYMALFNYAFAKQNDGEFLVRIEDTDRARFVEGAEQVIYDALAWLDIPYKPTFRQSERLPIYQKYAQELVKSGHAYYCFCTPERLEKMRADQQSRKEIPRYDRQCVHLSEAEIQDKLSRNEKHVIRMKMPENEVITWDDLIRDRVEINTKELDDQVIMKSDGFPTYHLAVVIDDHEMQITHIIRGEEWISSTPKHILLYRFLKWEQPFFAHMPLLRNPDKTKMSKRKNDVSIPSYKEKGYLSQALRNYLCLLGWSHPEEKDIFELNEFIEKFSFERMVKSGPIFDTAKLNWMNGKYIREEMSTQDLLSALTPFLPSGFPEGLLTKVLPLVKDRLSVLSDIGPLTTFFHTAPQLSKESLLWKKTTELEAKEYIAHAVQLLEQVTDWSAQPMEEMMVSSCDAKAWPRGNFFMTIRLAVTGQTATPPLFDTIAVLGKEETLQRLKTGHSLLS